MVTKTKKKTNFAILLTVYNRKEKTLLCLRNLFEQFLPEGYVMDVYLTDDGCTDGTPKVVAEQFPQVNIIKGDGNLFWNRGMYIAWEAACKKMDYDFYLWLNDDTFLMQGCLSEMIGNSNECADKAIIVATMRSKDDERPTYGGHAMKGKGIVVPDGTLQECATMNGNCVLVPREVYKVCGNLDWAFRHAIGDLDYGYRARKAGFKVYASKKYLGICEKNPHLPKWARTDVSLRERIKNLYSPLGYAEPLPFFHYECRNFGAVTAIKHFLSIHLRVLFPGLWKNY